MADSVCKSCGKKILWATTHHNRQPIPLDPVPVEGGNINVDPLGWAWVVKPGKGMYVSHFSTCAAARKHRKPRQKKEAT